ncbi:MAG: hypothetical protein NTY02_09735 [Acidobacteria bacterium]|nr:hypothetical protein [Acidobacteriota bacterium]
MLRFTYRYSPQTSIMLEHMATADDHAKSAQHLRFVAEEVGVGIR